MIKRVLLFALGVFVALPLEENGLLLGLLFGYVLLQQFQVKERLDAYEARLLPEEREQAGPILREAYGPPPPEVHAEADLPAEASPEPPPEPARPAPEAASPPSPETEPGQVRWTPSLPASTPRPAAPSESTVAAAVRRLVDQARRFILEGNTPVRVGVVILFIGVAFLVKYAVDNALFPLELRLAAAALGGLGLTGVGWRLRARRLDMGRLLQGAGAAVLYLTIFASYRLYDLIPPTAAFGLLVLITLSCGTLALLQNAQSLAIVSVLGGFAAPVLTSTGDGNAVALFSYVALLNLPILALAALRPWRLLNLVGFFCTFGLFGLWTAQSYEPSMLGSIQPFLVVFFLTYLAVAVLYAQRQEARVAHPADGTLVFGLPVAVFAAQAVLVDHLPYGLAWSALGFGLCYAAAAYLVFRRAPERLATLTEALAGIGLVLASLVLPFALDAAWTSAGWALEGAGLVWLGYRQGRLRLRLFGFLLQLAAVFMFMADPQIDDGGAFFNAFVAGIVALSAGALATAYLVQHHEAATRTWERWAEPFFLTLGLVAWLLGGTIEVAVQVQGDLAFQVVVAFWALTAALCAWGHQRLSWRRLRVPALGFFPVLVVFLLLATVTLSHPTEEGGALAWPLALAAHLWVLWRCEGTTARRYVRTAHAGGVLVTALLLAWEAHWWTAHVLPDPSGWTAGAAGVPLVLALAVVLWAVRRPAWPAGAWPRAYLLGGGGALLAALVVWYSWASGSVPLFDEASLTTTYGMRADPTPLPFIPVFNPVDLVLGLALLVSVLWYRAWQALDVEQGGDTARAEAGRALARRLLGVVGFAWLNVAIAQTVHQVVGVDYTLEALWAVTPFQAALTLSWTLVGVGVMAVAARRSARQVWMVGAVLLGLTVVKLLALDLQNIDTVGRIVTFIGVGLLLLLVGYLAPAPPASALPPEERPSEASPSEHTDA
ncbi:MAG: DUF2339 domain-containing protein [Bacteroidota bacterium]